MRAIAAIAVLALSIAACVDVAQSEVKAQVPDIAVENIWPQSIKANGSVTFLIQGLDKLEDGEFTPAKLVPFINGVPLKGDFPLYIDRKNKQVRFDLPVTPESRSAWTRYLGFGSKSVALSVGWIDSGPAMLAKGAPKNIQQISLDASVPREITFWILSLAFLFAFGALAISSNILRDRTLAVGSTATTFAYSLGRTQMAWWLVIVTESFLYVWTFTGLKSLNAQTLILLGISASTGLSAALVDRDKQSVATEKLALSLRELAILEKENAAISEMLARAVENRTMSSVASASITAANEERTLLLKNNISTLRATSQPAQHKASFFADILSDQGGVSLHRFQLLVWTLILGMIFVYEVVTNLEMPHFDDTLLIMIGISAGTYIGFKFPEIKGNKPPGPDKKTT